MPSFIYAVVEQVKRELLVNFKEILEKCLSSHIKDFINSGDLLSVFWGRTELIFPL